MEERYSFADSITGLTHAFNMSLNLRRHGFTTRLVTAQHDRGENANRLCSTLSVATPPARHVAQRARTLMKMDRADDMFEPYDDGLDYDYYEDYDPEQEDAANGHGQNETTIQQVLGAPKERTMNNNVKVISFPCSRHLCGFSETWRVCPCCWYAQSRSQPWGYCPQSKRRCH